MSESIDDILKEASRELARQNEQIDATKVTEELEKAGVTQEATVGISEEADLILKNVFGPESEEAAREKKKAPSLVDLYEQWQKEKRDSEEEIHAIRSRRPRKSKKPKGEEELYKPSEQEIEFQERIKPLVDTRDALWHDLQEAVFESAGYDLQRMKSGDVTVTQEQLDRIYLMLRLQEGIREVYDNVFFGEAALPRVESNIFPEEEEQRKKEKKQAVVSLRPLLGQAIESYDLAKKDEIERRAASRKAVEEYLKVDAGISVDDLLAAVAKELEKRS